MRTGIQGRQVGPSSSRVTFIRSPVAHQVVSFEYVGKTALTAIGPVSGGHYRFSHPGAIVEVDPRDIASLATVPNLRKRVNS
jgi:hypothetical protein